MQTRRAPRRRKPAPGALRAAGQPRAAPFRRGLGAAVRPLYPLEALPKIPPQGSGTETIRSGSGREGRPLRSLLESFFSFSGMGRRAAVPGAGNAFSSSAVKGWLKR